MQSSFYLNISPEVGSFSLLTIWMRIYFNPGYFLRKERLQNKSEKTRLNAMQQHKPAYCARVYRPVVAEVLVL